MASESDSSPPSIINVIRHDTGNMRTLGHFECTAEWYGVRCGWRRENVTCCTAVAHVMINHGASTRFVDRDGKLLSPDRAAKISEGKVRWG